MSRPRISHTLLKRIDQKLDKCIMDFGKKNNIESFRKASEEFVGWVQDLEANLKKQKKGRY